MPRILVPVDYSERSRDALHCAAMLARGLGQRNHRPPRLGLPTDRPQTRLTTASGEHGSSISSWSKRRRTSSKFRRLRRADLASKPELVLSPLRRCGRSWTR